MPSIVRGHNIVKAIREEINKDILFNIIETDSEVLFQFKASDFDTLEKYLKPKTNGAHISPFSSKNLPKDREYKIPDNELKPYKDIIERIGQNRIIELTHMTNKFLKTLVTKTNNWKDIKANMAMKGIYGKKYIHSIGKWEDYIEYLERNI